jgi:hypothetical protein
MDALESVIDVAWHNSYPTPHPHHVYILHCAAACLMICTNMMLWLSLWSKSFEVSHRSASWTLNVITLTYNQDHAAELCGKCNKHALMHEFSSGR